ncbi:hypothetical protein [Planomicrobium sp. Y74]|uniref:hypothetical protein n=1 Tax=Planomicrobium sp. Y74 TaxID=2478977 RepID=UPI000EF4FDEC|nr:hypothetical protein [Planomicrobium sp. Y74]RLQ91294.1 hypothetical protein D9754_06085 [Planomicrobium sp. Y74]
MDKERMKKHVLLYGGIAMVILSALAIYDLVAPGVGPVIQLPAASLIWIAFPLFMVIGIVFIVLGIYRFLFEEKI